jgi:hypothetical protein
MRSLGPETKLVRTAEIFSTELDQETVLMSVDAGAYYGLEGPAQSIWQALVEPLTLNQLMDQLVAEYEVPRETCQEDVVRFLEQLEREGLLRVE